MQPLIDWEDWFQMPDPWAASRGRATSHAGGGGKYDQGSRGSGEVGYSVLHGASDRLGLSPKPSRGRRSDAGPTVTERDT